MRYIVLLLVLLVGAGFVFINWPAVNAPAEVNLLITTAKAPITLMLLFWFSLLFVIVIYILFVQQTGSFATMRRLTKELQEQRKLATDKAKPSFLIKIRGFTPKFYSRMHLFGAENSISGIAKTRKDVSVLVELFV